MKPCTDDDDDDDTDKGIYGAYNILSTFYFELQDDEINYDVVQRMVCCRFRALL